jgi:hypothetical protein
MAARSSADIIPSIGYELEYPPVSPEFNSKLLIASVNKLRAYVLAPIENVLPLTSILLPSKTSRFSKIAATCSSVTFAFSLVILDNTPVARILFLISSI